MKERGTTTDDEKRSESPLPHRTEHYNVRHNPSQTSYSDFNLENYKYSFLHQVTQDTTAVQSIVDKLDEAWKRGEVDTKLEHANVVRDGLISTLSKKHCKKVIASQLRRMQNNQFYH